MKLIVPSQQILKFMFYNKHMGTFGERLKELRKDEHISQEKLAKKLNVSTNVISGWEKGRNECGFETLKKIADIFDVSCDYLLGRSDY